MRPHSGKALASRATWACRQLEAHYGRPRQPGRARNPLDSLIRTVLSQNTSDVNSERAYASLRERFPRWEDVLTAPSRSIAAAIRSGGLANQKSRRIKTILQWVNDQFGEPRRGRKKGQVHFACRPFGCCAQNVPVPFFGRSGRTLTLRSLHAMADDEVRELLAPLAGIGPKTVHVLMAFALHRDAFPVDTHVHRVTRRLGLIPANATAEKAHLLMAPLVPKEHAYSLHVNLIRLGRQLCHPRNPECAACPLRAKCPFGSAVRHVSPRSTRRSRRTT